MQCSMTANQTAPGVACPNCGYALRGLSGSEITCPECGLRIDLAALVHHRAIDRFDNPAYVELARPAMTLAAGVVVTGIVFWLAGGFRPDSFWIMLVPGALLFAWMVQLARALATADRAAVGLLALLHVVYMVGAPLVLGGIATVVVSLIGLVHAVGDNSTGAMLRTLGLAVGAAVVTIGGLLILRRLDRMAGRKCLRRQLLRQGHSY